MRKHAQLASIEVISQQDESVQLAFYNYNFFLPTNRTNENDVAVLNSVWHFGSTVDNLDRLFNDFRTFSGHHMVCATWNIIQNLLRGQILFYY